MGLKAGSIACVVIVVLLLSGTVRAEGDVVVLDTGMILEGKILSRDAKRLRMNVDGLGKMDVPLDSVRTINGVEPNPQPEPVEPTEPAPGDPEAEPTPEPEPAQPPSRVDVHYDEMKEGQSLLFILAGEDHGEWLETGPRMVATLGRVGKRRFKIVVDPDAGVLGERWVKREDLIRAICIEDHPERRLLFFSEGVESGSWIRGTTFSGDSFEGQLGGVSAEGSITLRRPEGDRIDELEIAVADLKQLRAVTRSKAMSGRIESLTVGEPVEFTVKGGDEVISGRVVRADEQWITVGSGETETHLFAGRPITSVRTLPDIVRQSLNGAGMNAWVTVSVTTEDDEEITRRDVTGRYRSASLTEVVLKTVDGAESVDVENIESVTVPETERLPALTARKETSSAETRLPVLPGMTRAEVEKRIPVGIEGIDILWEDDRVATVYVRPPYSGPVFGIRFDNALGKALTLTDLSFDTQITPKDSDEVVTMVSRTLTTYEVRLLVSKSGMILAAEVSAR